MQECRNWQTSKTKDLVADFAVWVQVPSPALKKTQTNVWVFFNAEESLEPKVQGLLAINGIVGRFAGKNIH